MTKREAKIIALRISTAVLHTASTWGEDFGDDKNKIDAEIAKIANSLMNRAIRLGGDFNEYTGREK
jgi:hypothetical protein